MDLIFKSDLFRFLKFSFIPLMTLRNLVRKTFSSLYHEHKTMMKLENLNNSFDMYTAYSFLVLNWIQMTHILLHIYRKTSIKVEFPFFATKKAFYRVWCTKVQKQHLNFKMKFFTPLKTLHSPFLALTHTVNSFIFIA